MFGSWAFDPSIISIQIKKECSLSAAFLRGEFMKKFYLLSNEVMSGETSFDEFSISRNCVHLVSEK